MIRRFIGFGLVMLMACGRSHQLTPSLGPAAEVQLRTASAASLVERTPWRCGAFNRESEPPTTAPKGWALDGRWLRSEATDTHVVVAFVADAGGPAPQTLAFTSKLAAVFKAEGVQLVVSLGGLGATQAEISQVLQSLGDGGDWPVLAIPGDREPAVAHAAAIADLVTRGNAVVDGATVRLATLPGLTIGTLPGLTSAARLGAAAEGCSHTDDDVVALRATMAREPGLTIIAGARAATGRNIDGLDGVSAGDATFTALLVDASRDGAPITASVHPAIDEASEDGELGTNQRKRGPMSLSAGHLDARTRLTLDGELGKPSALLVVVDGTTMRWRPLTP